MLFWHGGSLGDYKDQIKFKKGRYEFGPGLYATTHYDTAKKYSKGSKKLYLLEISEGNELTKSTIKLSDAQDFINLNAIKAKSKDALNRIEKYVENDRVPADIFMNILLNGDALKPSKMNDLREFLVSNQIDYEIVSNAFGWHENMIVVYNMNKVTKIRQITPKDEIKAYDLLEAKGSSMDSIIACSRHSRIARTLYLSNLLISSTNNKENFYKQNNIDEDELNWLGKGDFGNAYSIDDSRVLKITKSKKEFDIAKEIMAKNASLNGFVDYYAAEEVNGEYMIIMELLDAPGSIEDKFNELSSILEEQQVPIGYIDQYLDVDELDLDSQMLKFISDMEDIARSYRKMGIEAGDIRPENLGYAKNGKLKAFDIYER